MLNCKKTQDLNCDRCGDQKTGILEKECTCGGRYDFTMDKNFNFYYLNVNSISQLIGLFKEVARRFDFELLESLIDGINI